MLADTVLSILPEKAMISARSLRWVNEHEHNKLTRHTGGVQEKNNVLSNIYITLQHLTAFDRSLGLLYPTKGAKYTRTHLKNVFWPNIFVGASLQILDIQQYACGLRPTRGIRSDGESSNAGKLGPAAILNQNPIFEMDSR
jgi:hypothetical protein